MCLRSSSSVRSRFGRVDCRRDAARTLNAASSHPATVGNGQASHRCRHRTAMAAVREWEATHREYSSTSPHRTRLDIRGSHGSQNQIHLRGPMPFKASRWRWSTWGKRLNASDGRFEETIDGNRTIPDPRSQSSTRSSRESGSAHRERDESAASSIRGSSEEASPSKVRHEAA